MKILLSRDSKWSRLKSSEILLVIKCNNHLTIYDGMFVNIYGQ